MRTTLQVFNWTGFRNEAGDFELCIFFLFSSNLDAYYVCDFQPQAINVRAVI